MSRLARLVLLVALAAVLAWPHAAQAAPLDRTEAGGPAASQGWLAQLWAPLARLFGASGVGPGMDPDGLTEAPTMDPDGLTEAPGMDPDGLAVGPGMDPDGRSAAAGRQSAEATDEGPTMDPDGTTGSSGQEGDEGPTMDPNG